MRPLSIRIRFTLALAALGAVLFGAYGIVDYIRERGDLETAVDAEIRVLGRSLQQSLGNALRDQQPADVETTLRTLDSVSPTIDIHVRDAAGRTMRSRGAVTSATIEELLATTATARQESVTFEPHDVLYAAPLVDDRGDLLGAVAIVRPTADLEDDLARTRWRLVVVVVAFVGITSLVGAALGTTHVSRPLAKVLAGIRHVRDGDFHARVPVERNDEIGALVDEFNAMVAALAAANARANDATEARLRVEAGLQRIDKMVTIGQLSAGLAHEIGSPLQVLRGRASTILERTSDAEVRRHAQILVEQTDRISRIVEQLLAFGRRRPAAIIACRLDEPVRSTLELLGGEARRRGVAIVPELGDGSDLALEADADQLQQIVLNLVRNAIAVTPRGGRVVVRIEPNADTVQLIVRDTGPGISAEMRARLFEPFFTTRASEGGTGLGLAVVRSIVVEHGGSITVDSGPDGGAVFTVALPRRHERHLHV